MTALRKLAAAWPRPLLLPGPLLLAAVQAAFLESYRGRGDIQLYHRYAVTFWGGTPPLHQLPVEYPPLSLAVFSLSMLPPGSDHVLAFGAWMAVTFVLLLVILERAAGAAAARAAAAYLLLGAFATLLGRFDLVPALNTVGAVLLSMRGRHRAAYLLLAAGVLLKLYPVVLLPLLAAAQWREQRSPRRLLADLAGPATAVIAGFAAAALLSPTGWTRVFTYAANRPLQVESVPATIAWAAAALGVPFNPDHSFHSFNVTTPLAGALAGLGAVLLAAATLLLAVRVARGRITLPTAAAAVIVLAIVTGKVFSPQYLIWALPLVALAERRLRPAWLAVAALTTLVYPVLYDAARLYGSGAPAAYPAYLLAAIAARNLLLVGLAAGLLVRGEGREPVAGRHVDAVARGAGRDEVRADRDPRLGHRVAASRVEAP